MICQFTPEQENDATLKDLNFLFAPDVYPVGRLDKDSEGLLLLTNDNYLKTKYLEPVSKTPKTYLVQMDGQITQEALQQLAKGVQITVNGKSYRTLQAKVQSVPEPAWLPERNPPIRFRKNQPTSWIEMTIVEGKNRQVRKMTAAVGFPTLRLVRIGIAGLTLQGIQPGEVKEIKKPKLF